MAGIAGCKGVCQIEIDNVPKHFTGGDLASDFIKAAAIDRSVEIDACLINKGMKKGDRLRLLIGASPTDHRQIFTRQNVGEHDQRSDGAYRNEHQ